MEIIFFVVLAVVAAIVSAEVATAVTRRTLEKHHHDAVLADEAEYRRRWQGAVVLLGANGQLSADQIAAIMPVEHQLAGQAGGALPQLEGDSYDRCVTEVARAEMGPPPADNLEGMYSHDRHVVLEARAAQEARSRSRRRYV